MPSLTSILPNLAPTLGLTTYALYERQRALVRIGLLPAPQGRGRGSGAPATPANIALLVVAIMVTDNLSDTDDRVRKLASARFVGKQRNGRCPLTNAATFIEALTFLLSESSPLAVEADTLIEVVVSRAEPRAAISYFAWPGLDQPVHTEFGANRRKEDVLLVQSELTHSAFLNIKELADGIRDQ